MFDVASRRLHAQRLRGAPCASVRDAVRHFGAVQAQDLAGAFWAIAQRTAGATLADVERAYDAGEILRLHVLRPTWHFVDPADLRWLLALTAPRIQQAMKTYDRKLALDDKLYARSNDILAAALAGGQHRTRAELAQALARKRITGDGQRLAHLLMRAELDAVICSGPRRGADVTYALVADRVPPAPAIDRDDALARLAARYIASHGPALDTDFAWWSGLALSDARRALSLAKIATRIVGDLTYYDGEVDVARPRTPRIQLLPNFDEYYVAYRDRPALDPALARKLGSRADLIFNNAVIRNGALLGIWRRTMRKSAVVLTIATTAPLTPADRRALDAAIAAYAHYLARPIELA